MKSKASYSERFPSAKNCLRVSGALIREDFRRYWIIPAVAALAYFMCAIFPILMAYNDLSGMGMDRYIQNLLANRNPALLMFHAALPVITAVTLYRYMHNTGSAAVVHAMPFTRNTLYNSHLLSGLGMSIFPTVLCGAILLIISKPVPQNNISNTYTIFSNGLLESPESANVFARADILMWLWQSILIITVIYCLAAFVATATGNSIMHLATSVIFVFLASAFLGVLTFYFNQFVYGFASSNAYSDFLLGLSPLLLPLRSAGTVFSPGWVIFYLVCIVIFCVLGHFLYMRKKLERATESFTFKPMAIFMSYIAAFFGMTLFGFYFYAIGQRNIGFMYLGFAAGAVLIFLIAELIIGRSWYIFHKGTFKKLGIYAVIAILFLAGINFDVTGYETRIPDSSRVESVYIDEQTFSSVLYGDMGYGRNNDERIELKDPKNIDAAVRLHETLTQSRREPSVSNQYQTTYYYLEYTLNGGRTLARQYSSMDVRNFFVSNADIKTIMESQEYKSQIRVANLTPADKSTEKPVPTAFSQINLSGRATGNRSLSAVEQKEFYRYFKEDIMNRSFEDMVMPKAPFINVIFVLSASDQSLKEYGYYVGPSDLRCTLDSSFVKTLAWLKEKGYYDAFMIPAEDVAYITIDKIRFDEKGFPLRTETYEQEAQLSYEEARINEKMQNTAGYDTAAQYGSIGVLPLSETPPAQTALKMVVTDKNQIDKILHSYSNNEYSSSAQSLSTYAVTIYVKNPDAAADDPNRIFSLGGYYFDETIPAEFAAYFQ